MRDYEALYIIRPGLEEERYSQISEKFSAIIESNGGEVQKVDLWGKRRLAYEIEKLREGFYVLTAFKAEPALPAELERNFKIADEILRYLITVKPE